MVKSKIEWCDYSINPIKGLCPMACDYCYARRMYKRFDWLETIRYDKDVLYDLPKKPSRIFVGSTIELFGDWIEDWWLRSIFYEIDKYPQHTFIFLTKQPQNLIKWSPLPDNCWVGVSATDDVMFTQAYSAFKTLDAKVKFVSFEPLLKWGMCIDDIVFSLEDMRISWVIIGQQTPVSKKTEPKIEWIKEIVDATDKVGIPVFLKDNLSSIFAQNDCEGFEQNKQLFKVIDNFPTRYHLRQEFP